MAVNSFHQDEEGEICSEYVLNMFKKKSSDVCECVKVGVRREVWVQAWEKRENGSILMKGHGKREVQVNQTVQSRDLKTS